MDERLRRKLAVGAIIDAGKHTPDFAWYRIPDTVYLGLGALHEKWSEGFETKPTRAEVVKLLHSLNDFVPSLFQKRPPPEPTAIDLNKWKDRISGAAPPNPYAKETLNMSEQSWLAQNEPALAEFLKRQAEGGNIFSAIAKQKETEARNKRLRELEYDHENNVFRGNNMSAQNAFRQQHGDDTADFYKREATERARLPWLGEGNMGEMNAIFRKNPPLHKLIEESSVLAKEWAKSDIAQYEKEIGESMARAKAAKELLEERLAADREARNARIDALLR